MNGKDFCKKKRIKKKKGRIYVKNERISENSRT